ncbi:hypothetical protein CRG98_006788 [Punica granatum]|uniref:F-box associated domain-containing protein n=1 Tax=Punica granatum TaxID=22663 RepID=A0A2I0KWH6_PUNGR|nr:hypothetical protein CRG98_006788 [Punica granatum]
MSTSLPMLLFLISLSFLPPLLLSSGGISYLALNWAKIVCNFWHRLVSEEYFVHLQNELSVRNSVVLVEVSDSSESTNMSLIFIDNLRGVSEMSFDFLKDWVKAATEEQERPIMRFCPCGEAALVGLDCDLSGQKYNVVLAGYHRTFGHWPDGTFICSVFDSESSKWRKFVPLQDDHFTHEQEPGVFVYGALHWLTGGAWNRVYLLESDGYLSVIQISEAWLNIWVLKNYESEDWNLVARASLRCIRGLVLGIFPISQTRDSHATSSLLDRKNGRERSKREAYDEMSPTGPPFPDDFVLLCCDSMGGDDVILKLGNARNLFESIASIGD